jgi:hypothetical protein
MQQKEILTTDGHGLDRFPRLTLWLKKNSRPRSSLHTGIAVIISAYEHPGPISEVFYTSFVARLFFWRIAVRRLREAG